MMMVETKTRTQRRMEKKQALTLLVLVLVVSLSSFTLGVIVGRRGAERDLTQNPPEPRRIMVAEVPKTQASPEPSVKDETNPAEENAEEEKLTFYDNLSRGETIPLGSGINLPPEEENPVAEKPQEEKASVTTQTEPVAKVAPKPEKVVAPVATVSIPKEIPPADINGSYSVQVGSFSSVADAGRLKKSVVAKGYSAFIVEADLGAKGIWYRVRLGPYADADVAKKAMLIADKKDNIKGFVSRL